MHSSAQISPVNLAGHRSIWLTTSNHRLIWISGFLTPRWDSAMTHARWQMAGPEQWPKSHEISHWGALRNVMQGLPPPRRTVFWLSELDTETTRENRIHNERIDYKAYHNHIIYMGMYLIIFTLMYTIKVTIEIVLYTPSMTFVTKFTLNATTPTPSSMVWHAGVHKRPSGPNQRIKRVGWFCLIGPHRVPDAAHLGIIQICCHWPLGVFYVQFALVSVVASFL